MNELYDPYLTLGLKESADDDAVRRAYLEAVRRHPPEQAPEAFARVTAAYDQIRTEDRRLWHRFTGPFPRRWDEAPDLIPPEYAPPCPDRAQWMDAVLRLRATLAARPAPAAEGDSP